MFYFSWLTRRLQNVVTLYFSTSVVRKWTLWFLGQRIWHQQHWFSALVWPDNGNFDILDNWSGQKGTTLNFITTSPRMWPYSISAQLWTESRNFEFLGNESNQLPLFLAQVWPHNSYFDCLGNTCGQKGGCFEFNHKSVQSTSVLWSSLSRKWPS